MPHKFDINTKPLTKAKPCITLLIRDDGSTEWFEDCKAGQLLEIKSGNQKAYINLDYTKLMNFNINTEEKEFSEALEKILQLKEEKEKRDKQILEETSKLNNELTSLKQLRDYKISADKPTSREDNKEKSLKSAYDKRVETIKGKFVRLNKNKQKNFGSQSKPIQGFICYEKEFNALPYKANHDSKAITQWMDDILKNKKDFQAQRTEAVGKVLLYVLIGLGILAFIFFRWGAPMIEKASIEKEKQVVAIAPLLFPIISRGFSNWLKKSTKKESK